MDFVPESFDLIWAEGYIYIIGFKKGLQDWKKFLKPGGYLICSEISWFKDIFSDKFKKFWQKTNLQLILFQIN